VVALSSDRPAGSLNGRPKAVAPESGRELLVLSAPAESRRTFYEQRAPFRVRETGRFYQRLLQRFYAFLVPPGMRVLELGCGLGDLLAAVKPSRGVGVDFSPSMVSRARERHPELEFQVADAESFSAKEEFDYILMADLVNDLPDVQAVLEKLHTVAHSRTRLVLSFFNNLWRPILRCAAKLGLKSPTMLQNWLSADDVRNLLHLAGWEVIKTEPRILWPMRTPVWERLCNRWLAPLLPNFCLVVTIIARPRPQPSARPEFRCSVVIPARNEAGNIEAAVLRTPEMGLGTEIIFVEGHSSDKTWEEIQRVAAKYPQRNIKTLKQQSRGKGGAVREAFAAASGDILFILDADLTMPPEQLPKFYEAARSGTAEFINGVRLVYPMEEEAMQFLNMIANKIFGLTFSWLLGQKIKDTLCGTKVIFRKDYEALARNRAYFGEFDPFGDFDLLFGAAKLNLRLVDLPIRYAARTYGETNIHRWSHGWLLLRMVMFAARRLKFIR
jgi:ubiquinone/menaquinone biosynthesis C-methylase UbiE